MLRAFISLKSLPFSGMRRLPRNIVAAAPIVRNSLSTLPQIIIGPPATKSPPAISVPQRMILLRSLSNVDAGGKSAEELVDSLSPPRKKLLGILYSYKEANFEHDTPARFMGKILKAVDANHDGVITTEEFRTLLENIGASDAMSEKEINDMFEEVGECIEGEKAVRVEKVEAMWVPFVRVMWERNHVVKK